MIYDHEWRGAEVRRYFGVMTISFSTVRINVCTIQIYKDDLLNHFLQDHDPFYQPAQQEETGLLLLLGHSRRRRSGCGMFEEQPKWSQDKIHPSEPLYRVP